MNDHLVIAAASTAADLPTQWLLALSIGPLAYVLLTLAVLA